MVSFDPSTKSLLARHRQLAPNAAVRVSPLCLGTMTFGDRQQDRYGEITKQQAFEIMDTFYAQGGNFLDTANSYQNGQSEEWIGEWMAATGNRDELVIATKYTSFYRGAHSNEIKSNFVGNNSKSLKLLNDLVTAGKVLYLGISDCPAWIVSSANRYARDHGLRPFVIYQGKWNAAMRDFERDIIPMCRAEGMALAPFGIPVSARDKQVSAVLEGLAEKKGCTLLQVALAYCLQKTPYVFPTVGGRKVEHIQGSIEGLAVQLSEKEVDTIEAAYPFDHGFPHTFLSGTMFRGSDNLEQKQAEGPEDVFLLNATAKFDWVAQPSAIRPSQEVGK
ncbi:hypothetical protein DSL72_009207 [Monilinia vaccinii-corymbosi]|uniref:NADP-dependent oxidoreductase domain-containing protein n=1 Tax=Monilinia vaccinii-corymbosi TaxID=61207 RepID=A0A8A3PQE4_9HELO|nr:hypothetical protein DSL72_009207 [Monilinia vaccinii-corymbosi]